ncbi:hypothetical protein HTY61_05060 [Oricola thermophila]|uniref:Uncharacterized protein n=2 Tax=Oricola thermophila TaxID=2742145 RepID=A0A6N1VBD9_9HYPH|nr:hypothetical protein HTY61_05060 [Oricola thermophila]
MLYMHRDGKGIYVNTPDGRVYISRLTAAQVLKHNADALAGQFVADNEFDER